MRRGLEPRQRGALAARRVTCWLRGHRTITLFREIEHRGAGQFEVTKRSWRCIRCAADWPSSTPHWVISTSKMPLSQRVRGWPRRAA